MNKKIIDVSYISHARFQTNSLLIAQTRRKFKTNWSVMQYNIPNFFVIDLFTAISLRFI